MNKQELRRRRAVYQALDEARNTVMTWHESKPQLVVLEQFQNYQVEIEEFVDECAKSQAWGFMGSRGASTRYIDANDKLSYFLYKVFNYALLEHRSGLVISPRCDLFYTAVKELGMGVHHFEDPSEVMIATGRSRNDEYHDLIEHIRKKFLSPAFSRLLRTMTGRRETLVHRTTNYVDAMFSGFTPVVVSDLELGYQIGSKVSYKQAQAHLEAFLRKGHGSPWAAKLGHVCRVDRGLGKGWFFRLHVFSGPGKDGLNGAIGYEIGQHWLNTVGELGRFFNWNVLGNKAGQTTATSSGIVYSIDQTAQKAIKDRLVQQCDAEEFMLLPEDGSSVSFGRKPSDATLEAQRPRSAMRPSLKWPQASFTEIFT